MLYLSFSLEQSVYAIPVHNVEESVQSQGITRVPRMPAHVLGVMNLRGRILPVYDSRIRLGMISERQERKELIDSLKLRREEHIKWLDTLKQEVEEGRKISVQRNPSLCNFGKWYEPYMKKLNTHSSGSNQIDNVIVNTLKAFDQPHRAIHGLADRAQELMNAGNKDRARTLIRDEGRSVLNRMITLFKNVEEAITEQEKRTVIVVIKDKERHFGLTVDALDSTMEIDDVQETDMDNELIASIALKDDRIIKLLDLNAFVMA